MVQVSRIWLVAVALLMIVSVPSSAEDAASNWTKPPQSGTATATQTPPQASIPFASQHGIWNWVVADDKTVYVQDTNSQWYKADLMFHCIGLPFALDRLAFKFEPNGDFDRHSEILFENQRCPLVSLTHSDSPPGYKSKRTKPNVAGTQEAQPAPVPQAGARQP